MSLPLSAPPRLILFDLDDTLLDNSPAAQGALGVCIAERSEIFGTMTVGEVFPQWSAINVRLWNDYARGLLNERQIRHQRAARLLVWACDRNGACYTETMASDFIERYFELFVDAARPFDGIPELLTLLRGETALGVITNGFADIQRARLDRSGLAPHFGEIVISEETGLRKPQPEIFRHALERFNVQPHEAVMVGDNLDYDIAPAHAVGMSTVWLRWNDQEPDSSGAASATVSDIPTLDTLLRSLIANPQTV